MIRAVDLFAGAGGASEGLLEAATLRGEQVQLVAVNHWPIAVATHTKNHPEARHYCQPIESVDPREAVPGGKLDLLIAAPECTHHSTARGGKPINDQSRAGAWQILRWLDLLDVKHLLIENVPEFRTWGPLNSKNRPILTKKGETFRAFISAIESYGFSVEYKVLNAADYGAATTRRRLFIQARKGKKPINWPAATHSKTGASTVFGGTKKWRAAREVIDWGITGESIFQRKKALAPATMRRILEGLRRFGGEQLEPFLVVLRNHMDGQSIDGPLPTIAAEGQHVALAEPFIVPPGNFTPRPVSVDEPIPTILAGSGRQIGVAEPFLVPFYGERASQAPRTHAVDEPVPTIPTDAKFGVVEPHLLQLTHGQRVLSVDNPLPTVTTAHRGEIGIVEPMILPQGGGGVARPTSLPASTVHGDGMGLIEPFIVQAAHGEGDARRVKSLDEPLGALPCSNTFAIAEPFMTEYFGNGTARPITEPVPTLTTRDRLALVQPVVNGYVLDIRFRMLKPHELAAAMSFPKNYEFTGNKGEQVKQIGNAWDVSMGRALCGAILDSRRTRNTTKVKRIA